uniref:Uncharacterized protein n=1 Tax=Hyaloperonospora arabidopsidis (strain Emoy2) TaxID=559515 RepID=M4BUE2_HYAAE
MQHVQSRHRAEERMQLHATLSSKQHRYTIEHALPAASFVHSTLHICLESVTCRMASAK